MFTHKLFKASGLLSVAISTLFNSHGVFAQVSNPKEVVVTANRYENSLSEVQADVTVYTQEDIRKSGVTNLVDLLKRAPGISHASNGGGQQTSTLFVRGSESKHTLFLIDGQRIGPLDGFSQFQFQHFPIEQIDRVEILRGPGSSLYGSDAIGGVVQIITKKAAQQNAADLSLSLGNNHTRKLSGSATLVGERSSIRLGAGHEYSEGINARRDNSGKDRYRITSGNLSGAYDLSSQSQLTAAVFATDVNNEFDPNPQFNRNNQTVVNLGLTHKWENQSASSARLGSATEELEFPGFAFGTRSFQNQFALDHRFSALGGSLLLAYEYLDQRFETTNRPAAGIPVVDDTQANSVLTSFTRDWKDYSFQANLRFDANSNYQDVVTGQLSIARNLNEIFKVGGSIGTGFKRPNFSQIAGFVDNTAVGFAGVDPAVLNTNLKPEESENYEVFAAANSSYGRSRLSVFQNLVQDLIVGNLISPGNTRFSNQSGVSKIEGISISHEAEVGKLGFGASFDLISAKDSRDERLLRRPLRSAKFNTNYNISDRWFVGGELLLNSQRDDTVFPSTRVNLGGYGIVNAVAGFDIDARNSVRMRVDNLTGKDYELVRGFGVAKQDVLLSYQHKF